MDDSKTERNGHFRLRFLGSELELTGAVALKLGGWALGLIAVFGGGLAGAYAAFGKPQQILDGVREVREVQMRQGEALVALSATASALNEKLLTLKLEVGELRRIQAGRGEEANAPAMRVPGSSMGGLP